MDLPDENLRLERNERNGCLLETAIHVLHPRFYLSFHDLNQWARTDRSNNKDVKGYFDSNRDIVAYFQELHQIMTTAPKLDQERVWALAMKGATYDVKVQRWILTYALNYMANHFPMPSFKKETTPCFRFHQWVYIIRSFQGCDMNLKPDLFISRVLEGYLLSFDYLKYYTEGKDGDGRKELKAQHYDFSFNPTETIQKLQMIKLEACQLIKNYFIGDEHNCFHFLFLYHNDQDIYRTGCKGYELLKRLGKEGLFDLCVKLLFMRRSKGLIKTVIRGLFEEKDGTSQWRQSVALFSKNYHDWQFKIPSEDQDMKLDLLSLNELVRNTKRTLGECFS